MTSSRIVFRIHLDSPHEEIRRVTFEGKLFRNALGKIPAVLVRYGKPLWNQAFMLSPSQQKKALARKGVLEIKSRAIEQFKHVYGGK